MNATKVSEDQGHEFDPRTWACVHCGLQVNTTYMLKLRVCARRLAIRERLDAIDRYSEEATNAGHSDWHS